MISEIQGSQLLQRTNYANGASPADNAEAPREVQAPRNADEFIPSGEKTPVGLYLVTPNEDGTRNIKFNAPSPDTEQTTANTDNVDREIKALKDEQTELQRRLKTAGGEEAAELQRRLERVSAELSQKDNDQYRRVNAVFS